VLPLDPLALASLGPPKTVQMLNHLTIGEPRGQAKIILLPASIPTAAHSTPARDEFRVIMGADAIQATEGCGLSHAVVVIRSLC
jgi:hypothetical protein